MKDSVLLHRKAKPSKKYAHDNIPDALAAWNIAADDARQAGRDDLVEKYQYESWAGWGTIYMAVRKLREELAEGQAHDTTQN
jgi:hypothetical protein